MLPAGTLAAPSGGREGAASAGSATAPGPAGGPAMGDKAAGAAAPEKAPPPVALKEVARPIDPHLGKELRAALLAELRDALRPPGRPLPPGGTKEVWEDWPET